MPYIMTSFGTFVRKVQAGVHKALPMLKRAGNIASSVANVAGPALSGVTGGASEVIARGVQTANRMLQAA
jgi:hypothetical protein